MTPTLSRRAKNLRPSATFRLAKLAQELKSAGKDVLSFGLGEPDFPTPSRVCQAAIAAIERGEHRYTANEGVLPLREAIASFLFDEQGLRYDPRTEILVTAGAKQAVSNALMVLVDDGDEVLLPVPYWVTYPEVIGFCGGTTKLVPTRPDDGFHVRAEDIEKACTPRTKVLVLNSPNNPTGAVLAKEELQAIADVARRKDLTVVSDEIYGPLVYGDARHVSIAATDAQSRQRTVICHGMSKAFAMTGWRLGFAAGPAAIVEAMSHLQGHTTSNASSIAQHAAVRALRECRDDVPPMRVEFARRRALVVERLSAIDGFQLSPPAGAFYAFPTISRLFGRRSPGGVEIRDAASFCEALLAEALVSVIPGEAFGTKDAIRLSYAAAYESLEQGCERIGRFVASLA